MLMNLVDRGESSERDSTEMSSERIETEDGSDVDEQETPVVKRWSIAEGDEKSLVPNDHIGAVERSDVNAPKAVAQGNETEDICNRGYYIGHSSDSQDTGESTQVFPIALKQVRVNLHVTKEIEQLHRKYLQEQRERNQMMNEGEMGEGIEISSQQYSARRLTRQKNSGRRSSNTKKQMIEDETLELEVDEIDDIDMRGHRFTKSSKPKRLKKKTVGCSKCPKTFRFRSRLVLHMERSHGDAKPFQCKTCQKGFARSSSLRSHRRRNCSKPDKQPQVRVTQSTEDKKKYYYYSRVERVTCNLCGRSVRGPKMLKKHMQSHEVHKCEHCPKQFSQPTRLKYHMKMVHGDERPFKCEICGKAFAVPFLLKRHLPSHQEQKEHRCETCHKIYKSADTLRKHRVMHSENRKTYVCEVCGNVYKSRDGLTKHAQLHMQLTFTCDVCGATFKKSDYLRDHKNRMHPAEGTVQLRGCETCGKMFRCGLALRRHQRLHKVPDNNVMCEECGKTFKHKKSLNYHMLEHTGERPHKCQYCDRDFKDLYACKNHIKSVHCNERPYSCEYCDKTFSNRKVLRCHEVRFHSKTPVIICGRCGKFFKSETALRRHQKTELGQEAVMCELCGKVLVHKQSLMKHLKTHTTQQTHDCVFCEEQFPSRSDLLTHISSQHSSEEPVACNICDRVSRSKVTHDQHMQRVHSSDLYQCALCGKSFKSKKSRRFHMKVHLFQNLKC
ncbi:zinc finger protein 93-like [Ptychodera flava]|uniref:zinc finger protein 93-like n=1 Tax=Ptychodera flava TaxID=63121 RepID=UPI003969CE76